MIYLVQTDTTAGFLSKDMKALNRLKKRPLDKPCILCLASFGEITPRIPNRYKNLVRRAKKTTFILQNGFSFRIVKDGAHAEFLRKTGAMYSTSANETGKSFDVDFAKVKADVVVEDERGFFEGAPSTILKLGKKKLNKIR
ncbi:MAG: Sua5 YciO YrdC YwlC family protein [Campylobacteraceae bacterium]|jgi:tRNA A37 threonylcarbamoyladenosine synthetase subunit TsaC/SUA5/YrdC|nr:Sua5 YciO YrdC YwlC family protein [Campylobacteraceae bacterium]